MSYGKVLFNKGGEKGAMLQNVLITRLNAQGVITVPKATILKWFEEDKKELVGCIHTYVLHNKEEEDIFRTIMESHEMKDDSVRWKICRFRNDRTFKKWVKEAEENGYFDKYTCGEYNIPSPVQREDK